MKLRITKQQQQVSHFDIWNLINEPDRKKIELSTEQARSLFFEYVSVWSEAESLKKYLKKEIKKEQNHESINSTPEI